MTQGQVVLEAGNGYESLDSYLIGSEIKKLLLVCGESISMLKAEGYFSSLRGRLGIDVIRFSDFQPNPIYESVAKGVEIFNSNGCDAVVAVGGGSAMDVAKCIKLFSNMDPGRNYLEQRIVPNGVKLVAMPTTAGTGSEATRFAVVYYKGEKQSVTDWSCIPDAVLMDADNLKALPMYQRKSTMLDALCHAVESFWSVNSTAESREYSRKAIGLILENKNLYLNNDETGNAGMFKAANIAGRAINITQTTAGHAMCYKLTSLYGIAHGHAAALCVSALWGYMLKHTQDCIDARGMEYLGNMFDELADIFGCPSADSTAEMFKGMVAGLALQSPAASKEDYELLVKSVNPERMHNNPIKLSEVTIEGLYKQILGGGVQ